MIQRKSVLILCMVIFLTAGCQVFPYVYSTPTVSPTQPPEPTDAPPQPEPSATVEATATVPSVTDTPEETPTDDEAISPDEPVEATPAETLPYIIQESNPFYLANFVHPEAGCDWLGVAGQVFDDQGKEVLGLYITAGSSLAVDGDETGVETGFAPAYGLGGFEIQIAETPVNTSGVFWVQIKDSDGQALSEKIFFDTFEDCNQNLVLINFVHRQAEGHVQSELTPTPTLAPYP